MKHSIVTLQFLLSILLSFSLENNGITYIMMVHICRMTNQAGSAAAVSVLNICLSTRMEKSGLCHLLKKD